MPDILVGTLTPKGSSETDNAEHDSSSNVSVKRTGQYVWDVDTLNWVRAAGDTDGNTSVVSGFKIPAGFDYMELESAGDKVTKITYKTGGATGDTVGTLDLTYNGDNVATITKS